VVNPAATTVAALVVEALVAFLWVLAYYALFVEERASKAVAGLGVGLAYGAANLALAPITGASGNFARTFGAELSAKLGGGPAHWGQLWIYAVAPIVGGIVAVEVYDLLIARRPLMAPMAGRAGAGRTGAARPTPA
jgi:glycerol uptake facilitator-like aquaporin